MKFYIKKMGCKVNEYEAESLATMLVKNGHQIVDVPEHADRAIVLTCAVTREAEKKSRQAVSSITTKNPTLKVFVCGCSSQNSPNDYIKKDNVIAVLGTYNKPKIIDLINQYENKQNFDIFQVEELQEVYTHYDVPVIDKTRHFVKIQDGCNNFCAYCLIPYLRGRSRSRDLNECVEEIKQASKVSQEVVLTGINVSDFKCQNGGLEQLILAVQNIDVRLRISSIECNIINEGFLKELQKLKNFCPHFHLPLQSGCDKILKEMNRHYTKQEFLDKVSLIREYYPNCAITTDVIVGFPNETEEDFEETIETIRKANFADIHAFKYSPREGTRLAKLPPLDAKIANVRQARLLQLKKELHHNFMKNSIGKIVNVLTETPKNNYLVGYSREYLKVYVPSHSIKPNEIVDVKITDFYLDGVKGDIIKK